MTMLNKAPGNVRLESVSHTTLQHGVEDIGWQALGPTLACTLFATTVVTLRWYTRCRLLRCTGTDDYMILLSLILSWSMCGIVIAAKGEGLGVYDGFIDAAHLAKLLTANNALWSLTVNATKASILLQYLRVFSDRLHRGSCYALFSLLVIATCWAFFGGIFLCHPVAKLWHPYLPGTCQNAERYWISVAGINIGMDILVLVLPLPAIASLRLRWKDKTCVLLLLALGFVVCIVSILRLIFVLVTARTGDHLQAGIWALVWSTVEANTGIACASLLALKPLLEALFPRLMQDSSSPSHHMQLDTQPLDTATLASSEPTSESIDKDPKPSGSLQRFDTPLAPASSGTSRTLMPRPLERMGVDLERGEMSIMEMLRIDSGETYAFAGH